MVRPYNLSMNRRELFHSMISLWALAACRPFTSNSPVTTEPENWFYSGLEFPPQNPTEKKTYGIAASWNSESKIHRVKNVIHSVNYDPKTNLKVFLPKGGATAYFQTGHEELRTFASAPGHYFYGHGAFDAERKVFYSTQSEIIYEGPSEARKNSKGYIYVHALDDFRILDKFPTFGNDTHDVKLVGGELIVCNGGTDSNVSFIDPETRKLLRSFPLNDENLSAGHLDVLDANNFLIVTGAYRQLYPPAIYSLNRNDGLKKLSFPKELDSLFRVQLLSVANYQGFILATCPKTDSLLVWNQKGEFVSAQHVPQATCLAVSSQLGGVIVGSGNNNEPLRLVTFSGGQMKVKTLDWGVRSTGSHALVI